MEYKPVISPKMRAVADLLKDAFEEMEYCVKETRRNLIVEVPIHDDGGVPVPELEKM